MEENCPECKLIFKGKYDSRLYTENRAFIAYFAKERIVSNHIVIIPKRHISNIIDLSEIEWGLFGSISRDVIVSMFAFDLHIVNGVKEISEHLKIHLLPSGKDKFNYEWKTKTIPDDELKELPLKIEELKKRFPEKMKSIQISKENPVYKKYAFEDIRPGVICPIHRERHICSYAPLKDIIPAIYNPRFKIVSDIDFMKNEDPVCILELNNEIKVYPLRILVYHEVVNDIIGDIPVSISFCPLCDSTVVFERTIDNSVTKFGVSGYLLNSDVLMFDHKTESLWSQIEGKCVYGKQIGKELKLFPFIMTKWEYIKAQYSQSLVLSTETGFSRNYKDYEKGDYHTKDRFFIDVKKKDIANRLHNKLVIYGIKVQGIAKAYPEDIILEKKIINDSISNISLLIVVDNKMGVNTFISEIEGKKLTFELKNNELRDLETGSSWSFQGEALTGKQKGNKLKRRIDFIRMYYFAWVAFNHDTEVQIYNNLHLDKEWKEKIESKNTLL